ncbi:MAG: T9SS type A sorting domain-containing protein [Ignavibacteriae bacterium]|nr:T9SS type A sorting domain-containing protein [Ignavibacteriota bacterium]
MKILVLTLLILVLPAFTFAQGITSCTTSPLAFTDTAWTNRFSANGENAIGTVEAPNDVPGTGVVGIIDLSNSSSFPLGANATPSMYFGPPGSQWNSQQLGQVFGIALDADGNIYVTATTAYWNDNFGSGGAGAIYKINNGTGTVSVFATLPNSGSTALGNICYDCKRNQFFVTNMEDGKIYRISSSGTILSSYDPLQPDNGLDGYPQLGERIWGVNVWGNRVYYSVWNSDVTFHTFQNNLIRSVALNASGDFSTQDQIEIEIPYLVPLGGWSNPVSDISFSSGGKMLLAERSMSSPTQPEAHKSRCLEYLFQNGQWVPSSAQFSVGTSLFSGRNCAGGADYANVSDRVWVTGDALILQYTPSYLVYGLQGLPQGGGSVNDSYLIDEWGNTVDMSKTGMGDVEVTGGRTTGTLGSISGKKWKDTDGNCTQILPAEVGLPNWIIKLYPGPIITTTDSMGNYSFSNLPPGQYTVSESLKTGWNYTCPATGSQSVTIGTGQNLTDVNFANRSIGTPVHDLGLSFSGSVAVLGKPKHFGIKYWNKGNVPVATTITVVYPEHTTYMSATYWVYQGQLINHDIPTRTLTYDMGILPPNSSGTMKVSVQIAPPPAVQLGDQLHATATISPTTGDATPNDNFKTDIETVVASYDPNQKWVVPVGIGSFGGIAIDETLKYHIDFQNTGTFQAFDIIVRDTLPTSLDISTFEEGASSHYCIVNVQAPNIVVFNFPNINLPDSTSDEPNSHGWVEFTIKPFQTTPLGTDINNRVGIYFDYNDVVLTNYTQNRIVDPDAYMKMYRSFPPESLVAKRGTKTIKPVKRGAGLPNAANLLDEVVAQGGFRPNASESDSAGGMRIGISFMMGKGTDKWAADKGAERLYSWCRLTKWDFKKKKGSNYADIQATLEDKTGLHTGNPRGLDSLFKNGIPAKRLLGQKTKLPPKDHNNHLLAELIALKVNIASSQLEKTPLGFGELVYNEENPLDEMSVKEISLKADSAFTFWNSGIWDYQLLDSVISKINRAFAGSIDKEDTLSFISGTKLYLNGEKILLDVPYLKPSGELPSFMMPYLETEQTDEYTDSKPYSFALEQNYPNPFNPTTNFGFRIANFGLVTLKIYNLLGQEVATLLNNEQMEAGEYEIPFSAIELSSGVYFYRINVESVDEDGLKQTFTDVKRMLLMK